ncbi:glycosyltransferase [Aquamicrobium terrae]|uniref:Glycosyltransferase involved in cell wall biosynthesis n=1 Tax=Aquamicrobium terrae TaxID=1324945 RepID=A0ABV2N0P0_9HYPH
MAARRKVLFIGPGVKATNQVWGGSIATSYNFLRSMELSKRYEVQHIDRRHIKGPRELYDTLRSTNYDVLHVDDAGSGLQICYSAGVLPDVIGPISRAPNGVKEYKIGGELWESIYTPEWFYQAVVIRLNANEERAPYYKDKYLRISQGVDTEKLRPETNPRERRYVLWAGDANRPAKNYALIEEIISITVLPEPYEFKVMSGYQVEDYWNTLNDTVILINTSKYESFCAAIFEAKAKGVPTIYRQKLHNDRFPDGRIQVPYTAEAYRDEILKLLGDPELLEQEGRMSRDYCVENASFEVMKNSYEAAYDIAFARKSS